MAKKDKLAKIDIFNLQPKNEAEAKQMLADGRLDAHNYKKGDWYKKKDTNIENIFEIVDPTGISSYDDVARSYKKSGFSGETAIEILGALPLLGKIAKAGKVVEGVSKGLTLTSRQLSSVNKSTNIIKALPIIGKGSDAVQAELEYDTNNQEDMKTKSKLAKIPKYQYGGDINDPAYREYLASMGKTPEQQKIDDTNWEGKMNYQSDLENRQDRTNKNINTASDGLIAAGGLIGSTGIGAPIGAIVSGVGVGAKLVTNLISKKQDVKNAEINSANQETEKLGLLNQQKFYNDKVNLNSYSLKGNAETEYFGKHGINDLNSKVKGVTDGYLEPIAKGVDLIKGKTHKQGGIGFHNASGEKIAEVQNQEVKLNSDITGKESILSNDVFIRPGISIADEATRLGKVQGKLENMEKPDKNGMLTRVKARLANLPNIQESIKGTTSNTMYGKHGIDNIKGKPDLTSNAYDSNDIYGSEKRRIIKAGVAGGASGVGVGLLLGGLTPFGALMGGVGAAGNSKMFMDATKGKITDEKMQLLLQQQYIQNLNKLDQKSINNQQTSTMYGKHGIPHLGDENETSYIRTDENGNAITKDMEFSNANTNQFKSLSNTEKSMNFLSEPETKNSSLPTNQIKSEMDYGKILDVAFNSARFIDNINNANLIAKTPKVPLPYLQKAAELKTNFSIDANLNENRNAFKNFATNIDANNSNSATSNANKASAYAQTIKQNNQLFTNKTNIETELKNRNSLNNQEVTGRNLAALDRFELQKYDRDLMIQGRKSANVTNAVEDISQIGTERNLKILDNSKISHISKLYDSNDASASALYPEYRSAARTSSQINDLKIQMSKSPQGIKDWNSDSRNQNNLITVKK